MGGKNLMEKNTKEMVLSLIAMIGTLFIITAVLVTFLYFNNVGNKPAEYFIQDGILRISGNYGEEIKLSDIVGITKEERIPEIQSRSNGYDSGNIRRGYFNLKDIGQTKLLIESQKEPPFIFINVKSGLRILNMNEPTETEKLYEKLLEAWKQNTLLK